MILIRYSSCIAVHSYTYSVHIKLTKMLDTNQRNDWFMHARVAVYIAIYSQAAWWLIDHSVQSP